MYTIHGDKLALQTSTRRFPLFYFYFIFFLSCSSSFSSVSHQHPSPSTLPEQAQAHATPGDSTRMDAPMMRRP
jgi:hypothetical protein